MLLLFSHHDPDDTPAREWLAEAARVVERTEDRMDEKQRVLEVMAAVDRFIEIVEEHLGHCGKLMRDTATLLAALEHGQTLPRQEYAKRRELAMAGAELLAKDAADLREQRLALLGGGAPPAA